CLTTTVSTLYSAALPPLCTIYGIEVADASWTMTIPSIGIAATSLLSGLLPESTHSKGVGRGTILLGLACALYVLGCLIDTLSVPNTFTSTPAHPSFGLFLSGRVLTGAAAGVFEAVGTSELVSAYHRVVRRRVAGQSPTLQGVFGYRAGVMSVWGFAMSFIGGYIVGGDGSTDTVYVLGAVSCLYATVFAAVYFTATLSRSVVRETEVYLDMEEEEEGVIEERETASPESVVVTHPLPSTVTLLVSVACVHVAFYLMPSLIASHVSKDLPITPQQQDWLPGLISGTVVLCAGIGSFLFTPLSGTSLFHTLFGMGHASNRLTPPSLMLSVFSFVTPLMCLSYLIVALVPCTWAVSMATVMAGLPEGLCMPAYNIWATMIVKSSGATRRERERESHQSLLSANNDVLPPDSHVSKGPMQGGTKLSSRPALLFGLVTAVMYCAHFLTSPVFIIAPSHVDLGLPLTAIEQSFFYAAVFLLVVSIAGVLVARRGGWLR
ncbi:major facilitator superfamily protein, partial [Kipferlia bialata]